jgi:hypothetical protein
MIGYLQIYTIEILIFSIPAILISIPAYYILHKRNRIFLVDYGLPAYATTLLAILSLYITPLCKVYAVSNTLEDNILVVIISVMINYIKIFLPSAISTKVISAFAILIMFVITILLFLFIPSTGE